MKAWILAARPKTLPAAIVPVWVGCVLAWKLVGAVDWRLAGFTLAGALCIQVATNLFNDAIDARKGADTEERLGPRRVTASGMLSRRVVYGGAAFFLLLAFACGVPLFLERGWVMLAIGVPSLFLAYGYTGGPFPLAYLGLGELFVVLFFGFVAVMGTVFVQTGEWLWPGAVLGLQVGLLSAVLITINNLRDVEEDRRSGKRTLAVRIGREGMLGVLHGMIYLPMVLTGLGRNFGMPWLLLLSFPWFLLGLTVVHLVKRTEPGPAYNGYLALAALQLVGFAVVVTIAAAI
ncbi:MAG: 1,4-dihydroxy-2-naphthoate octaprenyltransferase [Verrucomicrobia bacterium]|nr:1,4-dihydroxy-2-naphthoate octaprenyltransferase [Verrucomicrobiota bacterium]